jgi:hypothetical protein
MGGTTRWHVRRMDFVHFTGEWAIYYVLIALPLGHVSWEDYAPPERHAIRTCDIKEEGLYGSLPLSLQGRDVNPRPPGYELVRPVQKRPGESGNRPLSSPNGGLRSPGIPLRTEQSGVVR